MRIGSLTQQALVIIESRGKTAQSQACRKILESKYDSSVVCTALHYYAQTVLPRVLPIFPALILLSSKAFGTDADKADSVAAAMMLITSSGDIHDDIVDESNEKFGTQTVVGRYGKNVALLAGDLLLVQGMSSLTNNPVLTGKQKDTLASLIAHSMTEIVKAESLETSLLSNPKLTPQEFFEVIKLKGSVAELHCKIGGLISNADKKAMDALASYGRTIGVLSTLKEEFVDMTSPVELEHRISHELPPYPMVCALQNEVLNKKIVTIKPDNSADKMDRISRLVLSSLEVKALVDQFSKLGKKELASNLLLKGEDAEELKVLLEALSTEIVVV